MAKMVTLHAKPNHFEWFRIIFVVGFCFYFAALLAGLADELAVPHGIVGRDTSTELLRMPSAGIEPIFPVLRR